MYRVASQALVWLLVAPVLAAQQNSALPADPAILVREAIQNEVASTSWQGPHYAFKSERRKSSGTELREMVETPEGILGRLIAINGRPLTDEQRQKEDRRLARLVNDPNEWRKKQREQKEDSERIARLLKTMPDAFLYTYAGTEIDKNGDRVVRLDFKANPNFDPPSREAMVFQGMAGHMLINTRVKRLARIEASLVKDVDFGWGILGHLDKGGRFLIEQGQVAPDRWDSTHMLLDFTGRALLFKTIRIKQDETTSDFRRVPDLTVAQAIDYLRQYDATYAAQNNGSRPVKDVQQK